MIAAKPSGSTASTTHDGIPQATTSPAARSMRIRSALATQRLAEIPTATIDVNTRIGARTARGQKLSGGEREQPVGSGGECRAQHRHPQREMLDEHDRARDAAPECDAAAHLDQSERGHPGEHGHGDRVFNGVSAHGRAGTHPAVVRPRRTDRLDSTNRATADTPAPRSTARARASPRPRR